MMTHVARIFALVIAASLGVVAVLGADVEPASAAGGIEVSPDGVTYSSTLPGALFDDITISVPGDSQSEAFWIRNSGATAGYLRVVLTSVTVSDPILGDALTLTAGTPAHAGSPVKLSAANPCWVLTEGELLAPGSAVTVSAVLALGNLNGRDGQGGSASFALRASISDAAIGSLPPTTCGSGTFIPGTNGSGEIPLAMTGAQLPLPLIIGAAAVLGVGLFLVVAARRRREKR